MRKNYYKFGPVVQEEVLFMKKKYVHNGPRMKTDHKTSPFDTVGTASANSMESDYGCTSRVYFDNVTLTSQKPRQYNNKLDCSERN